MANKETYDGKRGRHKVPVGLRLDAGVLERIRNAVWHLGHGLTVNGLVEEAAIEALERLEKKHNGGKPFADRTSAMPKGKSSGS